MKHLVILPQFTPHRACRLLVVLITLLGVAPPLLADTILVRSPEDVVRQAPLIVEAVVNEIRYAAPSNLPIGEARIILP